MAKRIDPYTVTESGTAKNPLGVTHVIYVNMPGGRTSFAVCGQKDLPTSDGMPSKLLKKMGLSASAYDSFAQKDNADHAYVTIKGGEFGYQRGLTHSRPGLSERVPLSLPANWCSGYTDYQPTDFAGINAEDGVQNYLDGLADPATDKKDWDDPFILPLTASAALRSVNPDSYSALDSHLAALNAQFRNTGIDLSTVEGVRELYDTVADPSAYKAIPRRGKTDWTCHSARLPIGHDFYELSWAGTTTDVGTVFGAYDVNVAYGDHDGSIAVWGKHSFVPAIALETAPVSSYDRCYYEIDMSSLPMTLEELRVDAAESMDDNFNPHFLLPGERLMPSATRVLAPHPGVSALTGGNLRAISPTDVDNAHPDVQYLEMDYIFSTVDIGDTADYLTNQIQNGTFDSQRELDNTIRTAEKMREARPASHTLVKLDQSYRRKDYKFEESQLYKFLEEQESKAIDAGVDDRPLQDFLHKEREGTTVQKLINQLNKTDDIGVVGRYELGYDESASPLGLFRNSTPSSVTFTIEESAGYTASASISATHNGEEKEFTNVSPHQATSALMHGASYTINNTSILQDENGDYIRYPEGVVGEWLAADERAEDASLADLQGVASSYSIGFDTMSPIVLIGPGSSGAIGSTDDEMRRILLVGYAGSARSMMAQHYRSLTVPTFAESPLSA